MSGITLYSGGKNTATYISNTFIDKYMARANGEFVKVYLYLLRCAGSDSVSFSLSKSADFFECTEKDILRALKYWEKCKLLNLEYDNNSRLSGIHLVDGEGMSPKRDPGQVKLYTSVVTAELPDVKPQAEAISIPAKPEYSLNELSSFKKRETLKELFFVAESYLGRQLTDNDLTTMLFWADELKFSCPLIEFLIETCVGNGHKSMRYMNRIAEDFAQRGIKDVDAARIAMLEKSASYGAVTKGFGIRDRSLNDEEVTYLKTWINVFGASPDLIKEACQRTLRTINQPSFSYANTILEGWHSKKVTTMEEVKAYDEAFKNSKKAASSKASAPSKFSNFNQRDNDYDELQRKLIMSSLH